jgi:hypothetical protein
MPHRMFAAACLLIVLGSACATAARAQSVADADHAMRAMDLRMRALNTARKNLQQMDYQREDQQASAARDITDADVVVFAAAVKVFTVAFFITGMKCPEDVRFSQKQFGLVVASFVETADTELSRVNDNLHNISAPAAVAEASSIRDAIMDLREFLQPFAIKE